MRQFLGKRRFSSVVEHFCNSVCLAESRLELKCDVNLLSRWGSSAALTFQGYSKTSLMETLVHVATALTDKTLSQAFNIIPLVKCVRSHGSERTTECNFHRLCEPF